MPKKQTKKQSPADRAEGARARVMEAFDAEANALSRAERLALYDTLLDTLNTEHAIEEDKRKRARLLGSAYYDVPDMGPGEVEANARLWAASPDMLKALGVTP